jgi:hypothetical protein
MPEELIMKKGIPITPNDIPAQKLMHIPPEVIDVFNEFIVMNWNGTSSSFLQKWVLAKVSEVLGLDEKSILDKHYLDVKIVFEERGWKVLLDQPGWDEEYEPWYRFSRKTV